MSSKKISISNAKIISNYGNVKWKNDSGNLIPSLRIVKNGKKKQVQFESDQLVLLFRLREQERLKRMASAKIRANSISRFMSRHGRNVQGSVVDHCEMKVKSMVSGFLVRWRLRRKKKAAIRIQTWYRDMLPLYKKWKKYWTEKHGTQLKEIRMKKHALLNVSKQSKMIVFVQNGIRKFICMRIMDSHMKSKGAMHLQSVIRMMKTRQRLHDLVNSATLVQSGLRTLREREDFVGLEQKIRMLKLSILRYYEKLNAPYTQRALLCFNTRTECKESFLLCLKELNALKQRNTPYMDKEIFDRHLAYVLECFLEVKDEKFTNIIRSIYQPDIIDKFLISLGTKRLTTLFNRRYGDGYSVAKPPIDFILREMIPHMFSSRETIATANWSSVLVFNYILSPAKIQKKAEAHLNRLSRLSTMQVQTQRLSAIL